MRIEGESISCICECAGYGEASIPLREILIKITGIYVSNWELLRVPRNFTRGQLSGTFGKPGMLYRTIGSEIEFHG